MLTLNAQNYPTLVGMLNFRCTVLEREFLDVGYPVADKGRKSSRMLSNPMQHQLSKKAY